MPRLASSCFVLVLFALAVTACDSPPAAPPTPSAEERARLAVVEHFQGVLSPEVWSEIERQEWFNGGAMSEDGLRLLDLLAGYFRDTSIDQQILILRYYPRGINAKSATALEELNQAIAIPTMMLTPWFRDGLDDSETALIDLAVEALPDVAYAQTVLGIAGSDWFRDGLDERESVVVSTATALGPKGREAAGRVLRGLDEGLFDYTRFDLPQSGETYLLVTSESQSVKGQSGPALDLLRRSMVQVETFAGRYRSKYLVVSVFGDLGLNCGIAQLLDDAPGIVSLNLACLQEQTVMHELAHVFIGGGPTWFAEGVADLVYYHFRAHSGAYLARARVGQVAGQIELNQALALGSEAYANQGALGAAFLVDVYRLIGANNMSAAIQEVSAMGPHRDGRVILSTLLAHTPVELQPQLVEIVGRWVRGV